MKKCLNCKMNNRDTDKYCRNCGVLIRSNIHYILINVLTIVFLIALIFIIVLFIVSYYVYK